jgi:hypothetical protein
MVVKLSTSPLSPQTERRLERLMLGSNSDKVLEILEESGADYKVIFQQVKNGQLVTFGKFRRKKCLLN